MTDETHPAIRKRIQPWGLAWVWLLFFCADARSQDGEILVLMHDSGRIERYALDSYQYLGTAISGLPPSNSILMDEEGRLLISTGKPGEMGTVLRYDPAWDSAKTPNVETLIRVPEGYGGRLHRATGLAWYEGDLLVASQNDGKVKRYDYPSGEWLEDASLATVGSITQIAIYDSKLFMTDYQAKAIRRAEQLDGTLGATWAQFADQAPWGLAFNTNGSAFWCTSANRILRTNNNETVEWAGAGGGIATPLGLTIGPDQLLYCANWQGKVTVWSTESPSQGPPLKSIDGPEVKGPISILFTQRKFNTEFIYKPSSELAQTPEKLAFFESHVRPLLQSRCQECHDAQTQEGGLRLDAKEGWEIGGHSGKAVQPGQPEESLLYRAILYLDKDLKMPPDGKLTHTEVATLRTWIEHGAIDPRTDANLVTTEIAASRSSNGSNNQDSWAATFQQRLDWWSLKPFRDTNDSHRGVAEIAEHANSSTPTSQYASEFDSQYTSRQSPSLGPSGLGPSSLGPIDRFIFEKLASNGLEPAKEASPETLLRRLCFVLTGLPPTIEQRENYLQAYEKDPQTAYETLVDSLLASPQFGEMMARHWMDVVRYTDTYGYEWDNPAKGSHEYRDYLIRAFNRDIGFDTLVREQIAGDLLLQPRINEELGIVENLIGPMFFHMGEHRHGSSRDFNGIHQEMVNNKIDAFSKAFLATTVACSRCHDHKLEAVSQRDYYALGAMFMTPRWASRPIDAPAKNAQAIARLRELRSMIQSELTTQWSESKLSDAAWRENLTTVAGNPAPVLGDVGYPLMQLKGLYDQEGQGGPAQLWKKLQDEWLTHRNARVDANKAYTILSEFTANALPPGWVMEGEGFTSGWVEEATPLIALEGEKVVSRLLPKGLHSHALSSKLPGVLRTPPQLSIPGNILSVKVAGGEFAGTLILDENSLQNESVAFLNQTEPSWRSYTDLPLKNGITRVAIDFATASLNSNFPPRTGLAPGLANQDFGFDKRSWLSITEIATHDAAGAPLDSLDLYIDLFADPTPMSWAEIDQRVTRWLTQAKDRWCNQAPTSGDRAILQWMLDKNLLPNSSQDNPKLDKLLQEYRNIEQSIDYPRSVNSMDERLVAKAGLYFNVRGNVDAMGELVYPATLSMFGPEQNEPIQKSQGSGRLELANSLLHPEHPLTSRVYVNRVWQWVFGTGLVASPDDFGRLGDRPSHPELLDWLARDFIDRGWSTKTLIKEIVMSSTFRQEGKVTQEALQRDPSNRLLHHFPTRRLQAEQIRDALLAVSGRLDLRLYGRPILPPRTVEDGSKRLYSGPIDGNGRRSLYLMMSIMAPPKFLTVFDLPDLKLPSGRRNVTNVPAQALLLLNDPLVDLAAQHWAQSLIELPHATAEERINTMFLQAFGRQATELEKSKWQQLYRDLADKKDATQAMQDIDTWKQLTHTLFNSKEFIHYR